MCTAEQTRNSRCHSAQCIVTTFGILSGSKTVLKAPTFVFKKADHILRQCRFFFLEKKECPQGHSDFCWKMRQNFTFWAFYFLIIIHTITIRYIPKRTLLTLRVFHIGIHMNFCNSLFKEILIYVKQLKLCKIKNDTIFLLSVFNT